MDQAKASPQQQSGVTAPAITLPKGGGAIRGIGEKFAANPVTGTGSMSVPIATDPVVLDLDRNLPSLTTPARATVRSASAGHAVCLNSPARQTRGCRNTTAPK